MSNSTLARSRVALVTGAFSGIGLACALRLTQAGWTVFAAGRHLAKGESIASEAIRLVKLDVTDEASITEAIQLIENEVGRLDLLVNNAGSGLSGAVTEASNAQIRQLFETNVLGQVAMIRAALPLMVRNRWGRVITIGSIMGRFALPSYGIYAASKFAIEGLSDAMRLEFKLLGKDFDVILIEPPFIRTGLDDNAVRAEYGLPSGSLYGDYFATTAREFIHRQINDAPSPDIVAGVIVKAANAAKPRARYVVTQRAVLILTLHRFLPTRLFETVMMSFSGLGKHIARS